jgi:hypothetical protein
MNDSASRAARFGASAFSYSRSSAARRASFRASRGYINPGILNRFARNSRGVRNVEISPSSLFASFAL